MSLLPNYILVASEFSQNFLAVNFLLIMILVMLPALLLIKGKSLAELFKLIALLFQLTHTPLPLCASALPFEAQQKALPNHVLHLFPELLGLILICYMLF